MSNKTNNLIFDFGFFNGDDTEYYLSNGFNVVALEANPVLYNEGLVKFRESINQQRLVLLNKAFNDDEQYTVDFYINESLPDTSTCDKSKTKFWGDAKIKTVSVDCIGYKSLINRFGKPYYIKCDIESLDYLLIKQIHETFITPKYLSFELSRFDYYKIFSYLYVSGYTKFQLINQTSLGDTFSKYSSGRFGHLLDDNWLDFDECLTRYMKYKELKAIDNKHLALGWVDIHARID